jgi:hypothetical protein
MRTILLILGCLAFSIIINLIINKIVKYRFIYRDDELQIKRFKAIKQILKEADYLRFKKKNIIEDEELMRLILDYSMRTKNYQNGIRFLNNMEKIKHNDQIEKLLKNALIILNERFNDNKLGYNKAA